MIQIWPDYAIFDSSCASFIEIILTAAKLVWDIDLLSLACFISLPIPVASTKNRK